MLRLINPVTKALITIRLGDLHAEQTFIEYVLDGYVPYGKREAELTLRVIDVEMMKIERRNVSHH